MDLHTPISGNKRDIPFGKIVAGRADGGAASGWRPELIQSFKEMNATGFGSHLYWDDRGHVFTAGSYWADSYRLKAKALTAYRNNQSFPAFFNDDQDFESPGRQPDIGDGDPSSGDVWGTWGGYYTWDAETIVDSASRWEATVFLHISGLNPNDVPSFDSARTDISIRRPQQFNPAEGATIGWTLTRLSDSILMHSGLDTVGQNGVVTIQDLTMYKDPCRLSVSSFPVSVNPFNDNPEISTGFAMLQNFPNPFKAITTVSYHIPQSAQVYLAVYNISGQLVEILVNEFKNTGSHSVTWSAAGIGAGIYYMKLHTKEYSNVKKCVILE
jgi:hypothetical protein